MTIGTKQSCFLEEFHSLGIEQAEPNEGKGLVKGNVQVVGNGWLEENGQEADNCGGSGSGGSGTPCQKSFK